MAWFNKSPGGEIATLERPPLKSGKVSAKVLAPARDGFLAEYAELAKVVGVQAPDLTIEGFKDFLREKDWPVYALQEVIAYMDKKAKAESKEQSGWEWKPLRKKDHLEDVLFGRAASRTADMMNHTIRTVSASDHYTGHLRVFSSPLSPGIGQQDYIQSSPNKVYDKVIPLHALRKVAIIEREFKAPVSFFVCDYALAPHIEYPDPFLMAVIKNDKLDKGVGRFVIDFWDEPGFGIEQMMK